MRVYVFRLAMLTLAVLGPVVARGDDQQIAQQIIEQLDSEKQAGTLKGFSIDLSVEEGTVWMSGRVANAEQHARALDIARRIPGVKQVVNDLTVNGSATAFGQQSGPEATANTDLSPRSAYAANPRQAAAMSAPAPQQRSAGGLFANFGSALQNATRRGGAYAAPQQQPVYQQTAAVEEAMTEPTPAIAPTTAAAIGTGVAATPTTSRRVTHAVLPVPVAQDEVATGEPLTGDSPVQHSVVARPVAVQSAPQPLPTAQAYDYSQAGPAYAQQAGQAYGPPAGYGYAQPAVPVYRGSTSQVPLAYAPARQVGHEGAAYDVSGGPVPMHMPGSGVGIAPARYDHPSMPGYAWPSYAAYPNYAAVTYPKQYSPTAWPYIGPFYPYPQVPLGWRKVSLEWDDGWWMLDFKDRRSFTHGN
jgi:hypothetical protein